MFVNVAGAAAGGKNRYTDRPAIDSTVIYSRSWIFFHFIPSRVSFAQMPFADEDISGR